MSRMYLTVVVVCAAGMLITTVGMGAQHTFHNAPASVIHMANPVAGSMKAAQAGRKLYIYECAQCHGDKGEGVGTASPLRTGPTQSATPGTLFWFITHGEPEKGMPPWSSLAERDRWEIVAYVKSLGEPRRAVAPSHLNSPKRARALESRSSSTGAGFHVQ
jgi:mono/diheme cytochrome c family protein